MSEERNIETRLDAVLADARDALETSTEEGSVTATPTLRAVASAASSLVEDADSETLLNAVDLGGEDGYDTIVAALSKGDEENVRELRQLLRLSKLADSWDEPEADEHRRELAALFDVGPTSDEGDGATDDSTDAADTADGDEAAEVAEDAGGSDDDDGGVAEDIVDTVVERFTDEGEADTADDAAETAEEADGEEGTADQAVAASLRSQIEDAADRLRSQAEEDDTDGEETEDEADEADTADPASGGGARERLSTMPEHGRNPTHLSTMPDGESSTRFSTMPKRR
jgi:hypothetical protein